jgi:hypothetical protein
MPELYTSYTPRVVVVIQTVGTGSLTVANDYALQQIDQLGCTQETFAGRITQGKPYALVGVASNLPWHGRGIEPSPVIRLFRLFFIAVYPPCTSDWRKGRL